MTDDTTDLDDEITRLLGTADDSPGGFIPFVAAPPKAPPPPVPVSIDALATLLAAALRRREPVRWEGAEVKGNGNWGVADGGGFACTYSVTLHAVPHYGPHLPDPRHHACPALGTSATTSGRVWWAIRIEDKPLCHPDGRPALFPSHWEAMRAAEQAMIRVTISCQ